MDLFMSKRLDDSWKNWSKPVNLGQPINTNGRELFYFVVPGSDEVIFCSTQNSDGYGDIKYFKLLPEDVIIPVEESIIAEDEVTIQEIALEILSGLGYKVYVAPDCSEAESLFRAKRDNIQLVLMDLVLPDMNGHELFQRLVLEKPDLKVVYMSGYSDEILENYGIDLKTIRFLRKPLSMSSVATSVRQALDQDV